MKRTMMLALVLHVTPLMCMKSMCKHQTLFLLEHQDIDYQNHRVHRLMNTKEDNALLLKIPEYSNWYDWHMESFRIFIKNVCVTTEIPPCILETCEECKKKETQFEETRGKFSRSAIDELYLEIGNNKQLKIVEDFINEVKPFFDELSLIKKLELLHILQTSWPNLISENMWSAKYCIIFEIVVPLFITSLWSVIFLGLMPNPMTNNALVTTACSLTIFLVMFRSGILSASNRAYKVLMHQAFDKRLAMKQHIIDHFIQELRSMIRSGTQNGSFKKIIRSRYCDLSFSFK